MTIPDSRFIKNDFLNKCSQIIEDNISNEQFGVSELAQRSWYESLKPFAKSKEVNKPVRQPVYKKCTAGKSHGDVKTNLIERF